MRLEKSFCVFKILPSSLFEINATINSKRDDIETMKYLYNKYSKHVPHYIRTKLYQLATIGDK